MKKKIISLLLAVVMIVGMLPLSVIPVSAAETAQEEELFTDVIQFDDRGTAISRDGHFDLMAQRCAARSGMTTAYGWMITAKDDTITIRTKDNRLTITSIDAVVTYGGNKYSNINFSKGTKKQNGAVDNGSTVTVTDINDSEVTIYTTWGADCFFVKFTVYYKVAKEYYCLDVGEGAYIDTGYMPTSNTRVVFDAEVSDCLTGAVLFGVDFHANDANYSFYVNGGHNYDVGVDQNVYGSGWGPGDDWGWHTAPFLPGRQTVELSPGQFKLGDTVYKTYNPADFTSTLPLYLFAINFFGGEINTFTNQFVRFYSCKIYEGSELKHEFVPAKKNGVIGVFDRKSGDFREKKGDGTMVAYKAATPQSGLPSDNESVILDFNGEITVSENTTINAQPGQSGIVIAGDREVTINIKEGKTLTVNGGAAVGRSGAGAGIEVPESASLTVCGLGTLNATGGMAAAGGVGGKGGDGRIDSDGDSQTYGWAYTGTGGNGGYGGGGAGAGIGGRGGYGGLGGAGGAGLSVYANDDYDGIDGSNGSNGFAGSGCGNIAICNTLKRDIQGGAASGDASSGGQHGRGVWHEWYWVYYACGGAGSGLLVWQGGFYDVDGTEPDKDRLIGTGHAGLGGAGSKSGNNGKDEGAEQETSTYVAGAGGHGGVGGGAGAEKTDVSYYNQIAVKPQLADDAQNFVYNGKEQNGIINLDDSEKYTVSGTVSAKNADTYTATFTLKNGCVWSDGTFDPITLEWVIEKRQISVSSRYHYTGSPVNVVPDDSLFCTAEYEGGKKTAVGVNYSAKLHLLDPENYMWKDRSTEDKELKYSIHMGVDEDKDHLCDICGLGILLSEYTVLTKSDTTLNGGIWYISDILVFDGVLTVKGNVTFYLEDDSVLTANKGILIDGSESSLAVFAQSDSENMGKIIATGVKAATGGKAAAGIGSGENCACGDITINGGNIIAIGSEFSAGIGSAAGGFCGNITVNGGTVNATGGSGGAGIGCGSYGNCDNITVSGGTVTATGGGSAAGIGGGNGTYGKCGNITVSGGTVTATGGANAVGIGKGALFNNCGIVTISDMIIEAGTNKDTAERVSEYKDARYVHLYPDEQERKDVEIRTIQDLEALANAVVGGETYEGVNFVLMDDIDRCTAVIGDRNHPFKGHFDGRGHTVTLNMESESNYIGLFANLGNGGEIKNVITAGTVKGSMFVGGVCAQNEGKITNCHNIADVTGTGNNTVGGVCGRNYGTITKCQNAGEVRGNGFVGGICGYNEGDVTNCNNTGKMGGSAHCVGGVCGRNEGTVTNCNNAGKVNPTLTEVGGVCGRNEGTVTNCSNTGAVTGYRYVGGVCGWNESTIANCYYDSEVYTGEVCGTDNGTTTESYGLEPAKMKAASGTNGALVDLLNGYVNARADGTLCLWKNESDEYPQLCFEKTPVTVTFDLQGHGDAIDSQIIEKGGKVEEPADPSEEEYVFSGWYKEAECENAWDFETDTVKENTVIYAKWTVKTYTVTFDLQGHGDAIAGQVFTKGGKVEKPADPSEEGYKFSGWFKEAECIHPWDFDTDTVTKDTTIYAKWIAKTCVITFAMQGHGDAIDGQIIEGGGKIEEPADPSEEGYRFGGWFKEAACITPWDFETDTVIGNTTLYAKWGKIYAVQLIKSGGNGGTDSITAAYSFDMPQIALPTREGYVFDGYYDTNNVKYYNADGTSAKNWDKETDHEILIAYWAFVPAHEHTYSENWSCDPYYHWHNATCAHTGLTSDFGEHTFGEGKTEGNLTVYTCTECGYKKTVYNGGSTEGEPVQGVVKCDGISLTLSSDIYINFYMQLTDEALANGKMLFTIGNHTVEGVTAQLNESNGRYYFACPLNVLEMAETVKAEFTYGSTKYVQEYSVERYIDVILNGKDKDGKPYSDEMKLLARKIANYGYYAQIYLESIHTNVHIVDPYTEPEKGYDRVEPFGGEFDINTQKAIEALKDYKVSVSGTSDNLSLYGSTVYFDSATALNYYVTVKNDEEPTAKAVNTVTGEEKQVEIKLYKGNIYIVSVKDIIATELADDIKVTINNEITLTGSVFAYCNSVVSAHSFDGATEKDTFAVNAMAAFYEYYKAAVDYAEDTVTFDNDTYCERIYQTVKHGEKVQRPDPDPMTYGFVFDGWYKDVERTIPWNFDTPITEDTTIYGKWISEEDFQKIVENARSQVSDLRNNAISEINSLNLPNDIKQDSITEVNNVANTAKEQIENAIYTADIQKIVAKATNKINEVLSNADGA